MSSQFSVSNAKSSKEIFDRFWENVLHDIAVRLLTGELLFRKEILPGNYEYRVQGRTEPVTRDWAEAQVWALAEDLWLKVQESRRRGNQG